MPPKKSTNLSSEEIERIIAQNEAYKEAMKAMAQGKKEEVTHASISAAIAQHRPSKYDGSGEPEKLEEWLRDFDKLFQTVACPEAMMITQAVQYLGGRADRWWTNKQDILPLYHDGENGEAVFGWRSFRKAMRDEFFPEHRRSAKRAEFDKFKQGDDMTVDEYYAKFMELTNFCSDLGFTEEMLAVRFEDGLRADILKMMPAGAPTSVKDLFVKAGHAERYVEKTKEADKGKRKAESFNIDQGNQKRGSYSHSTLRTHYSDNNSSFGGGGRGRGSQGRSYNCKICGHNHPGKDCSGNLVACFGCGKLGHRAYECFNNPKNMGGRGQGSFGRIPTVSVRNVTPGSRSQSNWSGNYQKNFNRYQGGNNNNQRAASGTQGSASAKPTASASTVQEGIKNSGKLFAMGKQALEEDTQVVTGNFLVNSVSTYVLFDSGASHSFIASTHIPKLGLTTFVESVSDVTLPSGKSVKCSKTYTNVPLTIGGVNLTVDLI
ncbi:uncharacterized protein LOC141606976 [Silene latifolia]|uniref:uncharacterized protein LOC141606976 n=1 Tax=Silene latifolia TaxID=37657 RepID=UPI003D77F106